MRAYLGAPEFRRLVRTRRAELDIESDAELARRIGVVPNTFSRWMTDKGPVKDPWALVRLADVLEVDRLVLLGTYFDFLPELRRALDQAYDEGRRAGRSEGGPLP